MKTCKGKRKVNGEQSQTGISKEENERDVEYPTPISKRQPEKWRNIMKSKRKHVKNMLTWMRNEAEEVRWGCETACTYFVPIFF